MPYPFNKQHEPILYQNQVLNVEPLDGNPEDKLGWNYLRGIDIHTGKTLWIAETPRPPTPPPPSASQPTASPPCSLAAAATTTSRNARGHQPDQLVARQEGKTIWRWTIDTDAEGQPLAEPGTPQTPTWQNLWVQHWSPQYAYWWRLNPSSRISSSTRRTANCCASSR
ncbi:MAG: hypothetical protein R2748_14845 [Bryobacterales bacterium]